MHLWWGETEGALDQEGDILTVHFREMGTSWSFAAQQLTPHTLVVLRCVAADHHHPGAPDTIRKEWLGTSLRFVLEPVDEATQISFTHEGLTPELTCFGMCEAGWNHFVGQELGRYLDRGHTAG